MNGQEKAGDHCPGVLYEAQTSYRLILRRSTPARPRMPEPNSMMLLGSGVVPVVLPLLMVKASEGIVPTALSEAFDLPLFSSQNTGSPLGTTAFCRLSQYVLPETSPTLR